MKAISLLQPWASLIAVGEKQWETRSWSTSHRGEIAIHASKGLAGGKAGFRELCLEEPFKTVLRSNKKLRGPDAVTLGHVVDDLPRGAIIALARIVRVLHSEAWVSVNRVAALGAPHEEAFGGYEPGRFAWELADVRMLSTPVPCAGALSIWEVPSSVEALIRAQFHGVSAGVKGE